MDTAEIDFEEFIVAWMQLHRSVLAAVAVAAPRQDNQFLPSKITDACNGLEALAASLWKPPPLGLDDEHILKVLKDGGINSKKRNGIRSILVMRQSTLEDKLGQLAKTLGHESASWLLGPSIPHWAELVARLRNSLTHGSPLPDGLSDDIPFQVMALQSATAVLQLALLRNAGYDNPMSTTPGELLWHADTKVTSHPNSPFVRHLETIASHSSQWDSWYRRLHQIPQEGT